MGRQHGQGRLGAVRSRAVVRGGRSRSCNGARRRQPQRPPPVVRRPGCGRRLGLAVPTAGSAGHDRPDSHAARAETVGPTPTCLAPSPATTAARSAGGGTQTTRRRWRRGSRPASRAGAWPPAAGRRSSRDDPRTRPDANPNLDGGSTKAEPRCCTSSWCSARRRAPVVPPRSSTGCRWRRPPPTAGECSRLVRVQRRPSRGGPIRRSSLLRPGG